MNYKHLSIKYQDYTDKFSYNGSPSQGHTYSLIYDRLFKPYQNKAINFLEIGLACGGNVAICNEYFKDVYHYGIDVRDVLDKKNLTCLNNDKFIFLQGSFEDEKIIKQVSAKQYDIILEDGSHLLEHQMKAIDIYLPFLKDDGIMIVEDVSNPAFLENLYSKVNFKTHFAYTIDFRKNKNTPDDLLFVIEHRPSQFI